MNKKFYFIISLTLSIGIIIGFSLNATLSRNNIATNFNFEPVILHLETGDVPLYTSNQPFPNCEKLYHTPSCTTWNRADGTNTTIYLMPEVWNDCAGRTLFQHELWRATTHDEGKC